MAEKNEVDSGIRGSSIKSSSMFSKEVSRRTSRPAMRIAEGSRTFLRRRVVDPEEDEDEKDLRVGDVAGALRGSTGMSCSEEGRKLGSLTGGLLPYDSTLVAGLPVPTGIPTGLLPPEMVTELIAITQKIK